MDIKTCLQHLAKSLDLIGLNISPTTWNISDNGSQLCMNIVFDHRPSYQGLQLRNFDYQSVKPFQKKSPSTLKRDRARMDNYLKKLKKKMSITPENAPHQISDNRLNFNVNAPDFMPMSSNIIKKSELVDNCGNIFPFAACDDQEFLKLMDTTAPMKEELKQIKSSLNSVSPKLKSLQQFNAKWEVCKSDLITQVAASALELKRTKEEMMEMKQNEITCRTQIRDLSMELTSLRGQSKQRSAMNRGAVATPPAPGPSEDCSPAAWMRDSRRQHGR